MKKAGLCFLIIVCIIGGALFNHWYTGPNRGIIEVPKEPLGVDVRLSPKEAVKDIDYVMSVLKWTHPIFINGIPQEVKEQYEYEVSHFPDALFSFHIWQAEARILSKIKDAHTAIQYMSKGEKSIPLKLRLKKGEVICETAPYEGHKVTAVNGIPINIIYDTFLEQSSFERTEFVDTSLGAYLRRQAHLYFLGINAEKQVVCTLEQNRTKYIVTHEYTGNLSMQTAFQEVIEHKVCNQFEQWKDEKLTE